MRTPMIAALGLLALGGCATAPMSGPVDVLRYHLGEPLARGTVSVQPVTTADEVSVDFRAYASAVEGELARAGYATAPGGQSQFVATVGYRRAVRGVVSGSPISIGLGGGSYGRGGGVGGGFSFPLGGNRRADVIGTELSVQLKSRVDGALIWEGRAMTEADERNADAAPERAAAKLAGALFQGFPGESGRTITVR